MKNIKSAELPKYSGEEYEQVAFRVYHDKRRRKYCVCLTAEDMDKSILDVLTKQYHLNLIGGISGTMINGKNVCTAELETERDTLADLERILNVATAAGREITVINVCGVDILCVRTGSTTFRLDNGKETSVPVYGIRRDEHAGMLGFNERYPEIPFTANIGEKISAMPLPHVCKYRAVLIQNYRACLILEYNGGTQALNYGFDSPKCLGVLKDKKKIMTHLLGYGNELDFGGDCE